MQRDDSPTDELVNSITLNYLLNPELKENYVKYKSDKDKKLLKDIKFYRKRIIETTKSMSKGEYQNEHLAKNFLEYAAALVYHFKSLDKTDKMQEEYIDIQTDINSTEDFSENDNTEINRDDGTDNVLRLMTRNKDSSLLNFVKITKEEQFIPDKKKFNPKSKDLKMKGVKKKSKDIIDEKQQ